jgi:DNA gyrase inhibitor GyrI
MTRIRTRVRDPLTVAYIEESGPYDSLPWSTDIDRLYAWARKNRARPGMRPMAVYIDDPATTPPARLRTQIAIPLHRAPPPEGAVGVRTLPGTPVVAAKHRGPASAFPATYAALRAYASEHGLEVAGPPTETYTRRPKGTGADAVFTARVEIPVRKRAAA